MSTVEEALGALELAHEAHAVFDIDTAIDACPIMIVLVDHDVFRSVPLEERADKLVLDTRGIWPDQPAPRSPRDALRLAG